ncbi:MAG: efflux RND transporter periplasmic adaptor subunit [Burkholderiales bacterium]
MKDFINLRWVAPGVVVVATAWLSACSPPAAAPAPVRAVRTMKVAPVVALSEAEYAGEVRARTESRLGFRVPGKLLRRAVDLGATVRPGQLLAQLDPSDLKLAQEAARAGVLAAQVNHDQTAADFKRYQDLHTQGFISAAELERRQSALRAAKAQWDQARAQADVQGNQADYAALRADAPGVVTGIDAEPGMVLGAGTPVLRLAHDGPRDVVFSVPEDRVAEARGWLSRPGQLEVRLWGAQDQWLPATVRELAAAADPATRTFLVKADVGRADVKLGQTVTVRVRSAAATTAAVPSVAVPLSAVAEQGGQPMVWLLDGATMQVRPQRITVEGMQGDALKVRSGLQPGQEIVTAGVHVLTPGETVRRWGAAPAAAASSAAGASAAGR